LPPPSSHTTGHAVRHPAVPVYWAEPNLRQRAWFRAWCRLAFYKHRDPLRDFRPLSGSLAPVLPQDFCPLRSESTRDYPLMTGSALRPARAELLWPRLTSGSSSQHLSMLIAHGKLPDLPGYDALTVTLMPVGYTSQRSVQVLGFAYIGLLAPLRRLISASCSSGQRFASSFLRIPPRGRHPCRSANTSPCRVCRGLSPPSECALPGAPIKTPPVSRGRLRHKAVTPAHFEEQA
jgi:hypothetical protein